MHLPPSGYKRDMVLFFYIVMWSFVALAVIFVLTKLMMPFVAAWLCALLLQPLINKFAGKKKGKFRKLMTGFIILTVLFLIVYLFFLVINRAYNEIFSFAEYLAENSERIISSVSTKLLKLAERFHIDTDSEYLFKMGLALLENGASSLSAKLTSFAAGLVMKLPGFLFLTVVFVMAAFYLSADFQKINGYIGGLFPASISRKIKGLEKKIVGTALKYFRAYLILLLITFSQLLIAFLILKIDYAVILAAIIAFLDILPAIGVGTVLVPWAIILFFKGESTLAIALLVTFAVIALVRQIAESHIIGSQLGISPLATLLSVYIGLRLFGVIGMLTAPLFALLVKNITDFYRQKNNALK